MADLARLLADQELIGIPRNHIESIVDIGPASTVLHRLAEIAARDADTLIVYYAGHGIVGNDFQLYLATGDTVRATAEYSGLSIVKMKEAIAGSPARMKVLILDCCYSGRAIPGGMGDEVSSVRATIENITGSYVITSSPANRQSLAPPEEKYTAFSGLLIEAIDEGLDLDIGEGVIRESIILDDIYQHIKRRSAGRYPLPERGVLREGDSFILAKNRKSIKNKENISQEHIKNLQKYIKSIDERINRLEANYYAHYANIWVLYILLSVGPSLLYWVVHLIGLSRNANINSQYVFLPIICLNYIFLLLCTMLLVSKRDNHKQKSSLVDLICRFVPIKSANIPGAFWSSLVGLVMLFVQHFSGL